MHVMPALKNSASDTLDSIQFADIFDLEEIQHIQDMFADATGVASVITLPDGTPITKPSNFCRLCTDIIRKTETGRSNCYRSDAAIGRQNLSGPIVQPCLSGGLWDAGASIIVGGLHIANWLIGQVRNEEVDEERIMQYANEIGADKEDFKKALNEVPVMSVVQFNKVTKMFFAFANQLSEKAYNNWQLKMQIAEREKATELLKESEFKYRELVENSPDAIVIYVEGIIVFVNNECLRLMAVKSSSELIGKPVLQCIHPDYRKVVIEQMGKAINEGAILPQNEEKFVRLDGTIIDVEVKAMPIKFENKPAVQLLIRDISGRKQVEETLARERYLMRSLMDNLPDHIYFKDRESRFIRINKAHAKRFNLDDPTLAVGKTDFDFFTDEHAQQAFDDEQTIIRTGQMLSLEEKETYPDRPDSWVSTIKMPLHDTEGNIIGTFGISRDITERKQSEKALRESEELYRNLIVRLPDAVYKSTHDGKFVSVNPAMVKMLEYESEEELMAIDIQSQLYLEPTDRESLVLQEELKEMGVFRLKKKDGSEIWIEDHGWYNTDNEGKILFHEGIMRNITDRKLAEEEIKQKNKELLKINAEKDKFFSIIAHDLRSPFSGLLGLSQIMAEELPNMTMTQLQEIAVTIRNSATNLFRLLDNLLHWTRMQQGLIPFNPEKIHLSSIITESMVIVLESAKNKSIEISYNIPEDITVFADSNILQTVIRNLASNAVKFTPKEGKITISAKETDDKNVEISVKDTGIGMSQTMIDNLFRIDIQTNRKGTEGEPSTGLGLLLCKEFVEKHDGKLLVESEVGKGSVFSFTIPKKEFGLS